MFKWFHCFMNGFPGPPEHDWLTIKCVHNVTNSVFYLSVCRICKKGKIEDESERTMDENPPG